MLKPERRGKKRIGEERRGEERRGRKHTRIRSARKQPRIPAHPIIRHQHIRSWNGRGFILDSKWAFEKRFSGAYVERGG